MQLDPYLSFKGDCEAAFRFYAKCLGGKVEGTFTYGQSPMAQQVPPEWSNKLMHARMVIGDRVLMGCDAPPDHYREPSGISLSISVKEAAEAERVFNELVEGGKVQMPLQKTFWSVRFGMLVDRYGIPWMVNCEQPAEQAAGA
jgi:PhnB protein